MSKCQIADIGYSIIALLNNKGSFKLKLQIISPSSFWVIIVLKKTFKRIMAVKQKYIISKISYKI